MKAKDLILELQKLDPDFEIVIETEEMHCSGHGEGEYCYCDYEPYLHTINAIVKVKHDNRGNKLEHPRIQINTDRQ